MKSSRSRGLQDSLGFLFRDSPGRVLFTKEVPRQLAELNLSLNYSLKSTLDRTLAMQ